MLEPFIWMFKCENFSKYYLKLFLFAVLLFIIGIISIFPTVFLGTILIKTSLASSIAMYTIGIFVLLSSLFLIQGYFWELTYNIIDRKWDIKAPSIYNGKVVEIFKVDLPEWNLFKFVWRGFASIVATIIMYIPWIEVLLLFFIFNSTRVGATQNFTSLINSYGIALPLFYGLFLFLIPSLLWNYASKDSVFATLNIFKAIYIIGNYTVRYIINGIKFVIFYLLDLCLTWGIMTVLNINSIQASKEVSILNIIVLIIFAILIFGKYLYKIHVYAYLLGTIAQVGES